MFDSSFKFFFVEKKSIDKNDLLFEHTFQFDTKHRKYLAVVEEYRQDVFIVKFFPEEKKDDGKKYQIILNDFEFAPIMRTCINIMLTFLQKNPLASFGYWSVNTIIENVCEEPKCETQRFRIYEYAMNLFFDPNNFKRFYNRSNSSVLMINMKSPNHEALMLNIVEMFTNIYHELAV